MKKSWRNAFPQLQETYGSSRKECLRPGILNIFLKFLTFLCWKFLGKAFENFKIMFPIKKKKRIIKEISILKKVFKILIYIICDRITCSLMH